MRAVPSGGAFLDDPDVVSAFTQRPTPGTATRTSSTDAAECATVELGAAGSSVTSGNLKAAVGSVRQNFDIIFHHFSPFFAHFSSPPRPARAVFFVFYLRPMLIGG